MVAKRAHGARYNVLYRMINGLTSYIGFYLDTTDAEHGNESLCGREKIVLFCQANNLQGFAQHVNLVNYFYPTGDLEHDHLFGSTW